MCCCRAFLKGARMDKVVDLADFFVAVGTDGFPERALRFVGRMTRNELQKWYAKLPEDWFDNPEPFPDGTSRRSGKRTFMFPLSNSWQDVLAGEGFELQFKKSREGGSGWGLRLQQYGSEGLPGGVIRPKKKKALTIPVTGEARGRRVKEFEVATGHRLFKVGKERGVDLGTLVWEDEATGELHAAYVLRKSSRVPSLKERRGHDALPEDRELGAWAARAYVKFFAKEFLK